MALNEKTHELTGRIASAPTNLRQQVASALENVYVHLRCVDAMGCASSPTSRARATLATEHLEQTLQQLWSGRVQQPFIEHYRESAKVCHEVAGEIWNPNNNDALHRWSIRMIDDASRIEWLAHCQEAGMEQAIGEPVEPVNERELFLAHGIDSNDAALAYEAMRQAWTDIAYQKKYWREQMPSTISDQVDPVSDDPGPDETRKFLSQLECAGAMPSPVTFAEIMHRSNLYNARALKETNERVELHWSADCPQLSEADIRGLRDSFTAIQHSHAMGEEPDALMAQIACEIKCDDNPAWADSMTFWGYHQCGQAMLEPLEQHIDDAPKSSDSVSLN